MNYPLLPLQSQHRSSAPSRAQQAPLLRQLHDEWRHISIGASELRTANSWGLPGRPVQSLDEVLSRCGFRAAPLPGETAQPHDADDNEPYLLRVVELARTSTLAARVVLQRILPGLSAVAGRHSMNRTQRHAVLDDVVANAWPIILKYPVERRPRYIVANLVRDTSFETFVRPIRRKSSGEIPTSHDRMTESASEQPVEALDELVGILNEARSQGVEQADIDLICQIVSMGRPEDVALLLNVTPRTVRNHRNAIVHRLRNVVAEAA